MGQRVSKKGNLKLKNGRKSGNRPVVFKFFAPQAQQVALAADFNNWDITKNPLEKNAGGQWSAKIQLAPGRYEYRFYVDGGWQNDQEAVECVPNSFGAWNCVLEVS